MNMTSEYARKALADADATAKATRLVSAMAGADMIVMMWGVIWFTGFMWSHFVAAYGWPNVYHALWFPLVGAGVACTILFEMRRTAPVRNLADKRIGYFWWAMYGYYFLGYLIVSPYLSHALLNSTPDGAKAIAAINTIVPMFAYVVMGLWLEQRHFICAGLGLTALTCLAYFVFNPIFFPFMAIVGGSMLFGFGLWMRMCWMVAARRLGQHVNV